MDKKLLVLLLLSLLCLSPRVFAQVIETYYTEDFHNGFANGMTREDRDGFKVSGDVSSIDAALGNARYGWVFMNRSYSDLCAASPSKYTNGGVSDDWLSTPAIELPDVDNLAFIWEGRSYSADEPDGYRILVSTTGPVKEDFTDEPIAVITAEPTDWTKHYASLDAYRGQTVYIAIHSNTAGFILQIDNLEVSQLEQMADAITLEDLTQQLLPEGENRLVLEGRLNTEFGSIITSADLKVKYDGGEYNGTITSFTPASDGSLTFRAELPIEVPVSGCLSYTYEVTAAGMSDSCSGEVYNPGPSDYVRRVVIEERTGTWCPYCIRGLAAIDESKERYPDNYIGIAVHNDDVMTDSYYDGAIAQFCDAGYPAAVGNRVKRISPYPDTFVSTIQDVLWERVLAGINVRAEWTDDSQEAIDVNVYTNFTFSANHANFNVALVILEQDVYRPGDSNYNQANGYAYGRLGVMGGYEQYGNPISSYDIKYPDVARGIYPEIGGELAYTSFRANNPALYQSTLDLPSTVLEKGNVEVVALLINPETGEIINAAAVDEADFGNMEDPGLGIADNVVADKAKAWSADGNLMVDLSGIEGNADVAVYALDGTCVARYTLQGGSLHNLGNLPAGLSIVTVTAGDVFETHKLMN